MYNLISHLNIQENICLENHVFSVLLAYIISFFVLLISISSSKRITIIKKYFTSYLTAKEHLVSFFQSLGTRFVRWYNTKYSRSGHLFQDRYYSIPVIKEQQYLATLTYIHNNPVKSALCRYPSEYRWSSFNAFYGQKNPLVDTSFSYNVAGSKDLLLQYFSSASAPFDDAQVIPALEKSRQFMPDNDALDVFKEVTELSSTSDVVRLPKRLRNRYISILHAKGLTQKQIARLMDVSISTVKRNSK